MDKYFGKKNVTNVKECLKEGTVYGPLCAYRLFYVGCSRAKRNLVIMINKKDIEGFEDKLRNKLMITGFNVLPYSVKLTIVLHPVFSAIIPAGN